MKRMQNKDWNEREVDPYEKGFADKLYGEDEPSAFPAYNADFGKKATPKSAYTPQERLNPKERQQWSAQYADDDAFFEDMERFVDGMEDYDAPQQPTRTWQPAQNERMPSENAGTWTPRQSAAREHSEAVPRAQTPGREERSAERRAAPMKNDRYYEEETPQKPKKKRRGLRAVLSVLLVLVLLAALVLGVFHFAAKQPKGEGDGVRKNGCTTILIAGTDASGDRTDTIMLMNINRSEKRISLMSIPRDTKVNSTYTPHKINSAYGVNGKGREGMTSLMDYVSECVGFRPDGYVLVDLDIFMELVDLMGGVEFYVPCDMDYESEAQNLSIHLSEGLQTLNGEQAMGVVRFRSGYAMADIQRVSVQRDFIMAALKQWASVKNVGKLPAAMKLLKEYSVTDLDTRNLLWLAESAVICGTGNMKMMTIPYYLDSYYVIVDAGDELFEMVNTYFNPYEKEITWDDLNIAY